MQLAVLLLLFGFTATTTTSTTTDSYLAIQDKEPILTTHDDFININSNSNNKNKNISATGRSFVSSSKKPRTPISVSGSSLKRRVCYFANWAPYRNLDPPLYPDDIDPELCTHIHYAFARIDPATLDLIPTEEHDQNWTEKSSMPLYIRLYSLKRRNTNLKIMLAVGGWSAKSVGFNLACGSHQNRTKFIGKAIDVLREWNFDGIDLDWEYPGATDRGANSASKQNFNAFVTEFRGAVEEESARTNKRRLLISSAVAADPIKINNGYDVVNLCRQLDYVNVMTYDYHGVWDDVTGLNSPLYARNSHTSQFASQHQHEHHKHQHHHFNHHNHKKNQHKPDKDKVKTNNNNWKNANFSINYWISSGCEPEKINFGLAAYGRSFTLLNATRHEVGAPALKGGHAGSYTKEEGIYAYYEICEKLNGEPKWSKYWDENQQSVYATHDDQWVGYDNERSIALKVKWAASMRLGGTMLWTLDFDDYSGQFCGQRQRQRQLQQQQKQKQRQKQKNKKHEKEQNEKEEEAITFTKRRFPLAQAIKDVYDQFAAVDTPSKANNTNTTTDDFSSTTSSTATHPTTTTKTTTTTTTTATATATTIAITTTTTTQVVFEQKTSNDNKNIYVLSSLGRNGSTLIANINENNENITNTNINSTTANSSDITIKDSNSKSSSCKKVKTVSHISFSCFLMTTITITILLV